MEKLLLKEVLFRPPALAAIRKSFRRTLCNSASRRPGNQFSGKGLFATRPIVCPLWMKQIRSRTSKVCNPREVRAFQREVQALSSLLRRSCVQQNPIASCSVGSRRDFCTSGVRCADNKNQQKKEDEKDEEKEQMEKARKRLMFLTTAIVVGTLMLVNSSPQENGFFNYISWNEFYYDMLLKGEVHSIRVVPENEMAIIYVQPDAIIQGQQRNAGTPNQPFLLKLPNVDRFEEKVREAEQKLGIRAEDMVPISFKQKSKWPEVIIILLLTLAFYRMIKSVKIGSMSGMMNQAKYFRGDQMAKTGEGISFKDVAGLKEAKVEVMEFVDYLKTPQRYKELGAKIPRGSLLLGPPGCGKTLLAKAVATEAQVPFLAMAGSEFMEMVGGLGAARVRDLFKVARSKSPCIIYIDEIDTIGKKRSGSGESSEEGDQTLNQLLVEMDGMGTIEGVIVLASTNRAEVLDKALLRPGRFDRHIMIDFPTLAERHEMFEMYLRKLKLTKPPEAYAGRLAQMTPGMTGADIANVCNEAALHAARTKKKVIDAADFDYASERVTSGIAKKTNIMSPKEKKVIAYHESGHALVGWLMEHTDALLKISIVPRTSNMLGFAQFVPSDNKLYSTQQLFERMCMALGGRAAEAVIFNRITTGAQNDLERVTEMAYEQVRSYGMSKNVGYLSFPSTGKGEFGKKPYSKYLANIIDQEAKALVGQAYRHTEQLLIDNKEKLHKLATTLLEREVLMNHEVEALIGPPPFGKKNVIDMADIEKTMPVTDRNNNNGGEAGIDNGDNGIDNGSERPSP